ncbi:hypothetical protein IQ37_19145 [Chryseobacterium piperi]|uniref:Uncharacterized protein n=1 Tax=Chryseobacterium piperi TaxID=558152 RepID=A0A086AAJ7_9FLAO|nr:hypothetical protein [Chryseobacterium piperi]ASW75512.1 hypothetical protein CJF12_15300 [Chryseobacterium piperi]KFF13711.1 hypothetical protein IQ37_19145 [Chryseobacterium piperi]
MNNYTKLLYILGLLTSPYIFSQENFGIMTNNPKEKLHVSGVSSISTSNIGNTGISLTKPTIRVDGLNIDNNPNIFTGSNTTSPLYVDHNGDTSVKKGMQICGTYTQPGEDAILTPTRLNIQANETYQLTDNLLTTSFTLEQRSVIYISSILSATIQSPSGETITDGKNKALVAIISFTNAPASSGITLNSSYITDGFTYSNRTPSSMTETFRLNPTCEAVLPAGNYTIVLKGAGIASRNSPNEDFTVIWGNGKSDKLNILARPL